MSHVFRFALLSTFIAIAFCSSQYFEPESKSTPTQKITVLASEAKPFVYQENHSLRGIEIEIINNFAKKFKLSVEYIVTNESLREVFSNDIRSKHYLQSIKHLNVDLFVGALEENLITHNSLIASQSFYHDAITWCIQKQKPIPIWKSFFHICTDPFVYLFFFVDAIFILGFGYFTQQFELRPKWDLNRLMFNGVCASLGFPCAFKPTFHLTRFVSAVALFAAIVFTTTTTSMLVLFITSPILGPQAQSIQEIISQKFNLMGDRFVFHQISQQNETYPSKSLNTFEIIRDPNDYFGQLELDDKLAIAASHELFASSTSIEERQLKLKNTVHCFNHPEYIHEYSLTILAHKHFTLMKELNRFIERVSENGCIVRWLKRYKFAAEKQPVYQYVIATSQSFVSAVVIDNCILLFALFVIMIERIVYSKVRTPNPSKFWRYIEMAIDSDRHFMLDDLNWNV